MKIQISTFGDTVLNLWVKGYQVIPSHKAKGLRGFIGVKVKEELQAFF